MELQSTSISLDKYWPIMKRRWLPAVFMFFSVFLIAQVTFFLKKPYYVAEGKLRFQKTNTTSSLTGLGTEIGTLDPIAQSNPLSTETEVIRSLPVIRKTINKLHDLDNKLTPLKPKTFLENLTIKDIKGADVLVVSYKNTDPKIAAKVVNSLMAVYLEENISTLRSEAAAAHKFIKKQLPNAELIVRKAEAELAKFKEKNKIISLQEEATKAVEILGELQKQININQSQLADVDTQSQKIRQQLGMSSQQALIMTSLSQSSGVQDILKEIQQLESQLAAKRTIFNNNHPQIMNLEDKLQALKQLLQKRTKQIINPEKIQLNSNLQMGDLEQNLTARLVELESSRLGLISQFSALSQLQSSYKQRLNNLPRLEQQQRQLERQVQASQSTYSLLLQKLQEIRITENQNVGNASIISEAEVPEYPNNSPIITYLVAFLLGTLSALLTVYILELKDKSIKTIDEAKELLGLTLLGVIPAIHHPVKIRYESKKNPSDYQNIIIKDDTRSPISEAYRILRNNLNFRSNNEKLKTIVITSSVPQEGKSTVAAKLAVTMAQIENKVLLIDADFYCPIQHQIWELSNSQGLSNLIIEQAEIKIAIQSVMNNLDVLTSGVIPLNPGSLLDSKHMTKLIKNLANNYDLIIIDTPSLKVAADAATLGQIADGVLLVVRPGMVDVMNAVFTKELLQKSGQNILGQVINGVIYENQPHK
jgi:capsular exopolysaccharide synthesis family protein